MILVGAAGIGKSDMAVRAVEKGLVLVADDHTCLWSSGGHLYAAPAEPDPTAFRAMTRLHLVVLAQSEGPRAPDGEITLILMALSPASGAPDWRCQSLLPLGYGRALRARES